MSTQHAQGLKAHPRAAVTEAAEADAQAAEAVAAADAAEEDKLEFIFLNVELGMWKVKLLCPPLADEF